MKKQIPARPKDTISIYSRLLNFFSSPVFVKDKEHRFVYVNDAFCSFFNVTYENFVGKKDDELYPKREWKIYRKKDRKILTTGEPDENEEYTTPPGGERRHVRTRKTLLESPDGEKYILGITTDITEKTALLRKIKENEKKYKSIFNLGSDPSALFRYPELTAVDVNASFLKMSNTKRSSVIGKRANHILSWVDPEERQVYFNILLNEHKVDNMEIHLRLRDGVVIPFLVSASMFGIDKKNYILYSLRDISNLKWTQKSLLESETLHKALVNNTPNLIMIHYCGVIVFINQAVTDFFNRPKELVVGQKLREILSVKNQSASGTTLNKDAVEAIIRCQETEIEITNPAGNKINFLTRSANIKYKGNNSIMTIFTDITERKNMESLILHNTIETEENERQRFAADLHDGLGPILSSIKLHLGMLQKKKDPAKIEETLDICEHLLDEVMNMVHRISHAITPHLIEDFGLGAAVLDLIQKIGSSEDLAIVLHSNLKKERFPRDVELHYYRIISELINNSIKHSGAKKITIDLHSGNKTLQLKYHDDGKGFDVSANPLPQSGIGIRNIYQRVNLMKGEIVFYPVDGKTEVLIRTPVEQVSANRHKYKA
jgi:PAS domain S-box-containing protein